MKKMPILLVAVMMVCVVSGAHLQAKQDTDERACPLIEQALKDYQHVKNATSRKDLEKYFVPDGGLQFPAKTRYVYTKCGYLHVDVEFELTNPAGISTLPDDKVVSISRLYVDYSAKD